MALPSPILVLTNQLTRGGAERYVLTLTSWLARQGVEAHLAATPAELLDELDGSVIFHPVALDDRRWSAPLAALRMRRIIRQRGVRALVANSLATAWIARLAAPRLPLVVVAHGWPAERYARIARPLAIADRVVAVSAQVRDRLVAAGLPAAKVVVVPNGIDLGRFGPLDDAARAQAEVALDKRGRTVLVHVGRFVPQKAQHRLIELAARLRDRTDWCLAIVGWGEREAELRHLIEAAGVGDQVKLLVSRSDVPDLLRASDLSVATSDWEGMPLSTIEAMAASLPIIATEVEGMEALVDASNGVLLPPGDADALEAAVRALLDDPGRRAALGRASRVRADARFSHEASCQGLAQALLSVSRS